VFLLLGLAIVVTVVKRKSKAAVAIEPMSAEEQAKLDAMLEQNSRD
jgi:cytochrome c-type biogenesis protein CcmH/NrfF